MSLDGSVVFLGAAMAAAFHWPGADTPWGIGFYQFAYCLSVALFIGGVLGIFRIRAERLARHEKSR